MNTPTRLGTTLTSTSSSRGVRHYVGMPPELGGKAEAREELPPAAVLVIEASEDGVLLLRYAASGRFAGDTWHPTVDEAKEQATYEFGGGALAWKEIPADVNDVVAFLSSTG